MSVLERLRSEPVLDRLRRGTTTEPVDDQTSTASPFLVPRVDLLPPEVRERRTVRLARYGLAGAALAAVALVAGLRLLAAGAVADAEDELAVHQAESTRLQTAVGEYASVEEAYRQVEQREAMLETALGSEVRWSYFLTDLSVTIPDRVWFTSLTVTQAEAVAPSPDGSVVATTGQGSLTFDGKALDKDDVSTLLEALGGQKGLTDPYFSSALDEEVGTSTVVSFSATATLTDEAFSGRYRPEPGAA